MSSVAPLFNRPLLIYDDKCYSCTRFAQSVNRLSRGWIRIAGHYYSQEAAEAKAMIFPQGFDPTNMFWLINRHGAFGARSGLPRVIKEIAVGILGAPSSTRYPDAAPACGCQTDMSCFTSTNMLKRICRLLSHGAVFRFEK
jgi:hypothetical protein